VRYIYEVRLDEASGRSLEVAFSALLHVAEANLQDWYPTYRSTKITRELIGKKEI
jgi:hypothetical protein